MSKIDDMIKELCPNGVEYKKLGDFCYIKTGKGITQKDCSIDAQYPVISGGTTPMGYYDIKNRDAFTVTISRVGANAGYVNFIETDFYLNDKCFSVIPHDSKNTESKYIYYFLKSIEANIVNLQSEGGVPTINTLKVGAIGLPIPPIEIQQEIVRILDNFTNLTAELQAELQARKEQYEYYRNNLLTFDKDNSDVKWMKVGDLFDFKNGLNKGKEFFGKGSPIVNFTDVYNNRRITSNTLKGLVDVNDSEIQRFNVKKGDVFFTRTSETKEDIGMASVLVENIENCVFSGFVLRGRPKTNLLLPEYCSYCFSTYSVRKEIVRFSSFTTRALTSGTNLSKIEIPIPPLAEQERIVSILDKFEALVNDLSSGLPAEIAALQEQYEYYRNNLLTFEKAV